MADPLALFQARLLDLLSRDLCPEEVLARLRVDPDLAPFRDYLDGWQPRMVEVASELVKKWGRSALRPPAPAG